MTRTKAGCSFLMISFIAFFLSSCAGAKLPSIDAAIEAEATSLLSKNLSHGLVIGIVKEDRVLIKGFGTIDLQEEHEPDGETRFQIGSLTKLLTVAAWQVLCDEGVFSPDDTLAEVIGAEVPLSPAAARITLEQLATHRSGLPRIPKSLARSEMAFHDPETGVTREEVLAWLATGEEIRKPGRKVYSNYGMGLLGHILELKTGRPLDDLVTDKVLLRLGMKNSGFGPGTEPGGVRATGYLVDDTPTDFWPFTSLGGAGAMYSTASDMMLFAQANFDPSSPLYEALLAMQRPLADGQGLRGWQAPGFPEKAAGNRDALWHNGLVGGYASYLSIDPQRKISVLILSNKTMDVTLSGVKLTRDARQLPWAAVAE